MARPKRPEGKTTRIMEEAVRVLADLPDGEYVFITNPHTKWLRELEREFKREGLVGVKFLSIDQIRDGKLRGHRGVLLIDDAYDISSYEDHMMVFQEQQLLKIRRR